MSGSYSNQQITGWSNQFTPTINQAAAQYGVPPLLLNQQLYQESSFNPAASNGNAYGIAQFMPGTASALGVNSADPTSSIFGAAQYDQQLYQQTGSWLGAMTQYGTLPASGSYTSGQQVVANMAQSYDTSQAPAQQGGVASGLGNQMLQGLGSGGGIAGLVGGYGAGGGAVSANGGNPLGQLGGAIGGAGSGFSTFLAEVGERGILIVLGLVLILGGFYLLGQDSKAGERIVAAPVPA